MELNVFCLRLGMALITGMLIGFERQIRRRSAGLSTNALVAVGACIFILTSETVITTAFRAGGEVNNDNLRVLSQVVTGIGFLGAGAIIKEGFNIHGLNSAATIWCSAAVGCLCGYGYWEMALIATGFIIFINLVLKHFEHLLEKSDILEDKHDTLADRPSTDKPAAKEKDASTEKSNTDSHTSTN